MSPIENLLVMKRIKVQFLMGLFSLLTLSCSNEKNAQKPNVILVFIDDMGWADFSCFGNTDAQTPNIDQLASEGISFEQFYVNSPICSPSRIAISNRAIPPTLPYNFLFKP